MQNQKRKTDTEKLTARGKGQGTNLVYDFNGIIPNPKYRSKGLRKNVVRKLSSSTCR
jgi:hypothetical protein